MSNPANNKTYLETRVIELEATQKYICQNLIDIRQDIKDTRQDMRDIRQDIKDFRQDMEKGFSTINSRMWQLLFFIIGLFVSAGFFQHFTKIN